MTSGPAILAILALAQLPASPDPTPVPIAGVVVDATDRPVAGAEVWLAESTVPDEGRRSRLELTGPLVAAPGIRVPALLARTRTDAEGHFTIEVPASIVARRSPPPLAIWTATTGREVRLAWRRLPRVVLADDPPSRIALPPAAKAEVAVLDHERRPVARARIVPLRAGSVPVPEPLGTALATETDADGRAAIIGPIDEVRVETTGHGVQILRVPDSGSPSPESRKAEAAGGSTILTLAPVGRVAGRLVASDAKPIRGVTIRAATLVGGHAASGQGGFARVACDERGRFEIPAIAAGMMTLEPEYDPAVRPQWRASSLGKILVPAGRTAEVMIPVREAFRFHGVVREKETDRPVAGTRIRWALHLPGDASAVTDASGRYQGFMGSRAITRGGTFDVPIPYVVPGDSRRGIEFDEILAPDDTEKEVPPIELARGVDVVGSVVDDRGSPVAGAEVEASGTSHFALPQRSRTDRAGRFVLRGVDPIAELGLIAWKDGLGTGRPLPARAEAAAARPIVLKLDRREAAPIVGRVVDPDGRPVAGASVRIWHQNRVRNAHPIGLEPILAADGSAVVRTDEQGRYRVPRRGPFQSESDFRMVGEYYAEAEAPGRPPARSPVVALDEQVREFPPIVLRRLRTVTGRLVDRRGQPIAEALVNQSGDGPMPTETTSDRDGRFMLPGVLESPAIIFARKGGFRTAFVECPDRAVQADGPGVTVTLARTVEAPIAVYKALPPALPQEEERALALRLIRPQVDKVLAGGRPSEIAALLYDLAAIDPAGTLERLETVKLADPGRLGSIRIEVARNLVRTNPDDAFALVEACPTADQRAGGYDRMLEALPDLDPARARQLVDVTLLNARETTRPLLRLMYTGHAVGRLIDLGDNERARVLIREGLELARAAFPGVDGSSPHRDLAVLLVRIDPLAGLAELEAQMRLAEGAKSRPGIRLINRAFGEVAQHLAARDPAMAEQLALRNRSTRGGQESGSVLAVCAPMATADLPRARGLAERITREDPVLLPRTLGRMAEAIGASDKAAATRLLDDAYTELERLADTGWTNRNVSISQTAGLLLPIVERVDAARLPEFLARSLALRPPAGSRGPRAWVPEQVAPLALQVARYDRGLAGRVLQPELDSLGLREGPPTQRSALNVLIALAFIDPRQAVERIEQLPDRPGPDTLEEQARLEVARLLALPVAARWRSIDGQ